MWLTPAERRGAVILVTILLVGTAWDVWRAHLPARSPARRAPDAEALLPAESLLAPTPAPEPEADHPGQRLDLNSASEAALDALPGIGPVLAGRIVARRARVGPYGRLEELLDVPGIGPRLFARLRPLVVVTPVRAVPDAVQSAKTDANGRAVSASERIPPDR
jgi:competence ComEA-like helix-hairpin-helix protein